MLGYTQTQTHTEIYIHTDIHSIYIYVYIYTYISHNILKIGLFTNKIMLSSNNIYETSVQYYTIKYRNNEARNYRMG